MVDCPNFPGKRFLATALLVLWSSSVAPAVDGDAFYAWAYRPDVKEYSFLFTASHYVRSDLPSREVAIEAMERGDPWYADILPRRRWDGFLDYRLEEDGEMEYCLQVLRQARHSVTKVIEPEHFYVHGDRDGTVVHNYTKCATQHFGSPTKALIAFAPGAPICIAAHWLMQQAKFRHNPNHGFIWHRADDGTEDRSVHECHYGERQKYEYPRFFRTIFDANGTLTYFHHQISEEVWYYTRFLQYVPTPQGLILMNYISERYSQDPEVPSYTFIFEAEPESLVTRHVAIPEKTTEFDGNCQTINHITGEIFDNYGNLVYKKGQGPIRPPDNKDEENDDKSEENDSDPPTEQPPNPSTDEDPEITP